MELEAAKATSVARVGGWWSLRLGGIPLRLIGMCGLLVTISVAILLAPINYAALGDYGYFGVFVVTLVATGMVFLPVPYLAVIMQAGSFLNPWTVALVAGVAAALGELSGYFIGATGRSVLPDSRWYRFLDRNMRRLGVPMVFLGSIIPNPIFDAIGVVAGMTRLPIWQFMLVCFAGKAIRFLAFAAAGAAYLS